ncbi:MAG: hypothetical protein AB7P11_21225 [Hydrogenophaga sp.]|uniref:hypothetical protein n=1 Tax=Hydrogenophaga sp. TaxID=1904254 RepID=UPI003D0DD9FB
MVYQDRPCKHCGGPVVAPKRRGVVKDFCSDRHRAAFRDATIARQIEAAEAVVVEAGHVLVDMRNELDRQVARMTGALAMLERCRPKRMRQAAQPGTESEANERKGIDDTGSHR